jgi:hypothetical protein
MLLSPRQLQVKGKPGKLPSVKGAALKARRERLSPSMVRTGAVADRRPGRTVASPPLGFAQSAASLGQRVQQRQHCGQVPGGDQAVATVEAVQKRHTTAWTSAGRVMVGACAGGPGALPMRFPVGRCEVFPSLDPQLRGAGAGRAGRDP